MKKEPDLMKKVLLSLAAVAAISAAVPAAAQTYSYNTYGGYDRHDRDGRDDGGRYDRGGYGWNGGGAQLDQHEAQLASRINAAYRRGEISRYEASRLSQDLGLINGLEMKYRRRGLDGREFPAVERRLDNLAINLERARRGERPYNDDYRRYGYNDRGWGW